MPTSIIARVPPLLYHPLKHCSSDSNHAPTARQPATCMPSAIDSANAYFWSEDMPATSLTMVCSCIETSAKNTKLSRGVVVVVVEVVVVLPVSRSGGETNVREFCLITCFSRSKNSTECVSSSFR